MEIAVRNAKLLRDSSIGYKYKQRGDYLQYILHQALECVGLSSTRWALKKPQLRKRKGLHDRCSYCRDGFVLAWIILNKKHRKKWRLTFQCRKNLSYLAVLWEYPTDRLQGKEI